MPLASLRTLSNHPSTGPEPEVLQFKAGDEVTVIRRMTMTLPQSTNPKFRKDLVEGTQGLVKGWADKEKRLVLVKFTLTMGDKPKAITHPVTCRNLKLTSEYLLEQGGVPGEPPKPTPSSSSDLHQGLEMVLGKQHLKTSRLSMVGRTCWQIVMTWQKSCT